MLHPKIEVRKSRIQGTGIFATDFIKEGEVVWHETPEERERQYRVPIERVKNWPDVEQQDYLRYAYQISEELYAGRKHNTPEDPADYTNHSCDANTWFVNDHTMTARRDILPGEEVTYDYATSETDENFLMACGCGAANCRKIIRGTDHLLPEVQAAYGSHMMQHALRCIAAAQAKHAMASPLAER
ncbi:SET domain-containing protein-lysine N-methyltransferase [candidate division KSB1 bacterium]|nr:SET domain-containing protein-lysine N-methyltransferase [candidate division KSB1 bacterium]